MNHTLSTNHVEVEGLAPDGHRCVHVGSYVSPLKGGKNLKEHYNSQDGRIKMNYKDDLQDEATLESYFIFSSFLHKQM